HIKNTSNLTTGRSNYWKLAFDAFKEKPFFGYGGSSRTSRWLTSQFYGEQAVIHNLYLEILVNYGLVGLFGFGGIIYLAFKDYIYIKKQVFFNNNRDRDDNSIFIIPFI